MMSPHSGSQCPGFFNRDSLGLCHYIAHALHGHRLHCRLQVEDVQVHGATYDGPIRRIHCCFGWHIAMFFCDVRKLISNEIYLDTLMY